MQPRGFVEPDEPAARVPRWGLGDAVAVYVVSLVLSVVAGTLVGAFTGAEPGEDTSDAVLATLLGAQFLGLLGGMLVVTRRKGAASLRRDFGLELSRRGLWAVPAGVALQILIGLALWPLRDLAGDDAQSVVEELRDAGGVRLAIIACYAAFAAPFIEELFFRGLVLRALQRRMRPAAAVAVSALVFGVVHLADPSIGTLAVLPGLVAVGAAAGWLTVRYGAVGPAVYLHFGFNLLTVLATVGA